MGSVSSSNLEGTGEADRCLVVGMLDSMEALCERSGQRDGPSDGEIFPHQPIMWSRLSVGQRG